MQLIRDITDSCFHRRRNSTLSNEVLKMAPLRKNFLLILILCIFFYIFVVYNQLPTVEIEKKEFGNYSEYLRDIGFYDKSISIRNNLPEFTFVTAVSNNHAAEGRHLAINISIPFPGKKLIAYGMQLSEENEMWFKKACNVDYRQFNLSRYPKHVSNFKNYAFKPLIIAEALKEFEAVLWLDSSSQFRKDRPIEGMLQRLNSLEVTSEEPHMFLFHQNYHTNYAVTHSEMYNYLPPYKQGKTLHRMQYSAAVMLIYRTRATMDLAMKWLVLCALEENCIAPPGANLDCDQKRLWRKGFYADCHRYDQSAVNLILAPYDKSHLWPKIVDDFVWTERYVGSDENSTVTCK